MDENKINIRNKGSLLMWFWKRTVERFLSFDLDKAIEFSVLNELLEKL